MYHKVFILQISKYSVPPVGNIYMYGVLKIVYNPFVISYKYEYNALLSRSTRLILSKLETSAAIIHTIL